MNNIRVIPLAKILTRVVLLLLTLGFLFACTDVSDLPRDDSNAYAKIYRIDNRQARLIPGRMLEAINNIRVTTDVPRLRYSSELNAAAFTHARDMSFQNRPWHFGSDRSSPVTRVSRAGFEGDLVGENIAESFEVPLDILGAWLNEEEARQNILDPQAKRMGVGWHQDSDGRIWWVMLVGT